ncbi:MAG: amidohydrolase [Firmicutes bacterium]|nr:amidohydrolase [Bacillota bacterium]
MDKLFYNGKIVTMDGVSIVQAVGVDQDRIVFTGSDEEAANLNADERIDLQGALMLPGFNEGHMHTATYSFVNSNVTMFHCRSVADCLDTLRQYYQTHPDRTWIYGRGWNDQNFDGEKRYPTRQELDEIAPDIPVMAVRACGHAAVCNTVAIQKIAARPEAAEMLADRIHLDSGVVNEAAVKLFYKVIDEPSFEDVENMLEFGLKRLSEEGITTCQSDDLLGIPGAGWRKVMQAYRNLDKAGRMPVRIWEQCLFLDYESFSEFVAEGYRTKQGGGMFRIGPLKLLLDGSLGAKTAAITDPYPGEPGNRGLLLFTQEQMDALFLKAQENDISVAVHCIGDRAMETVLNAVEYAQAKCPKSDIRHGIVHAQITTPAILERMAKDHVIGYIQPVFVGTDMDVCEARIGHERAKDTYAWKTMQDLGILTVGGSDAPVERFDVLENIYFAVTRQKLDGTPAGGWLPEQKLSVYDAVKLFTVNAAKSCFMENELGQIREGFLADLVVLSEDIFTIDPDRIKDVCVTRTVSCGKTVFRKEN